MMSALEAGGRSWKSRRSKGGCANLILQSVPNADKGVKKSKYFADVIYGCSLGGQEAEGAGAAAHVEHGLARDEAPVD